jgi:M6 family metalloprotease-like protein
MRTNRRLPTISITLIISFLFSGCGGNVPATEFAAEQTPTPVPVTDTPTATIVPTLTPTLAAQPVAACKLQSEAFTNVGLGFPKPSHKLPTLGTVKTIVLFADFPDVPASQKPEEIFSLVSPEAETFIRDLSYGRMEYILEPYFVWLRLGQLSSHYGEGIRTYDGHLGFIQEAVNLADATVDFSQADSVLVMVPPQASAVAYGPAFGANPSEGYIVDGKTFENGVTSGADLPGWGFLWLNHETGHIMSLPDLYAYVYDVSSYEDQHRFVGGFSLMGYIDGRAPEIFAFERWQLGWLDDEQIFCQQTREEKVTLSAIELAGGIKAVIVPINNTKAVVVESRRALGYDKNILKAGALVYTVIANVFSGEGPIVVYPALENDPYRDQSPLAVGESVIVEGVTITVLEATETSDTVQVTVEQ